jgi:peptidoglycan DL-endopeptidase CwlO
MIKGVAVKASLCAAALTLSFGYGSISAKAATHTSDMGIAGITPVLDSYFTAVADGESGEAEKLLETLSKEDSEATNGETAENKNEKVSSKTESPYANLGISIANENSYVNIRKKPSVESEIVGKLYPGCAADILETEGEWVKIHSGKVDGYVKSEYLAIGKEAEKLIDKVANKYVIVNTQTLRVREGQGTDTDIVALIPEGEKYYIVKEYKDWIEILIDLDDNEDGTQRQITGFVSRDLVTTGVEFKYAISIEEEKAKLEAEEKAKKAEAERLEKLAQEQEEKRKKEEASKAAAQSAAQKAENSRNENSSSSYGDSSSGSATGSEIANYALNFVGNPYVYGGTSLTNGTDCSGFVKSIYAHFGYSLPRTSSGQSQSAGREVSLSSLQPGDLIFYRNSSGNVSHVALYIGGGRVVHASNERDGIKVSNINYRTPYKARRIVN